MTKKEMIQAIQKKEAELFISLQEKQLLFEEDNSVVKRARTKWNAIYTLLKELGLEADVSANVIEKTSAILRKKVNQ
jgi:hypothetical protein